VRAGPPRNGVFLNIPLDSDYERLFVTLVAGLVAFGCEPRCAIAIPETGVNRLEKIFKLLTTSQYSIHEMSRVKLSGRKQVPRFNMPFELGLAVAWSIQNHGRHGFILFEEKAHRLEYSLNDLNGHDVNIHGGTHKGILKSLRELFQRQPPVSLKKLESVAFQCRRFMRNAKKQEDVEIFSANGFRILVGKATDIAVTKGLLSP